MGALKKFLKAKSKDTRWSFSCDNINKEYRLHGPCDIKIEFVQKQIEHFDIGKSGNARLRIAMQEDERGNLLSFERLWKIERNYDDDPQETNPSSEKRKVIPQLIPYKEEAYSYISMDYRGLLLSLPDNGWYEAMIELNYWVYGCCRGCFHKMRLCDCSVGEKKKIEEISLSDDEVKVVEDPEEEEEEIIVEPKIPRVSFILPLSEDEAKIKGVVRPQGHCHNCGNWTCEFLSQWDSQKVEFTPRQFTCVECTKLITGGNY